MAVLDLEIVQAGYESTPGTGVAATRILDLPPRAATLKYDQETLVFARAGSFASAHVAYPGAYKAGVDIKNVPANYDDLPWFANFFTTPQTTGTGAGADKTYTNTPSDVADVGKRATLEMTTMEASAAVSWKLTGCAGKSFGLKWDRKGFWSMDASWLGMILTSGITKTAALSARSVKHILGAGTKIYVDTGSFGGTQVTGRVYGGEFDVTEEAVQDETLDGAATDTLAPSGVSVRGNRKVTAKFKIRLDAGTEWTPFKAATALKVRVEQTGPVLGGSNYKATLDIGGVWDGYDFGDEGGYRTVGLSLAAMYDPTLAADWKLVTVNAQGTLV